MLLRLPIYNVAINAASLHPTVHLVIIAFDFYFAHSFIISLVHYHIVFKRLYDIHSILRQIQKSRDIIEKVVKEIGIVATLV